MSKGNRNQFVDIMRGIAMLLVVLGHTMTGCTVGAEESFLFNIVWSLQMPMFILISGYVTKYSRGIVDGAGLWKFFKRRTLAYLLPWVVWSFLVRGIIFGSSNFLNIKWLLWHMDSGYWFLVTIWTISMIFGVSTFAAKKISRDSEVKQIVVTFGLYIIGMAVLLGIGLVEGLSFFFFFLTLYYMPFYFVGYLYGQYRDKILKIKWGKSAIDGIIAVCLVSWLIILTRVHLYALPDRGMAIILRAVSSITGCVAICGLCKGLFKDNVQNGVGGGTAPLVRISLSGDLSYPLSASKSVTEIGEAANKQHRGFCTDIKQLPNNGRIDDVDSQTAKFKQDATTVSVWSQRIGNCFHWAGKKSLEIYMVHGLVLNVLMPENKPVFPSIVGYGLIGGNFVITVLLCAAVISLISQNSILKKILGMK